MISIVIPLYNEEENVELYPERLFPVVDPIIKKFGYSCEYIMVDDGSTDSTQQRLREIGKTHPNVIVLTHEKNQGLGAALRTGFVHSKADLVITMDSDLTYQPQDIEILLDTFQKTNADCISASPYREREHSTRVDSQFRLFVSKSVNFFYRVLLPKSDITCVSAIFRLYKSKALEGLTLESTDFNINAEIISKLMLQGKSVVEVGVPLHEREYGESKLNVRKEIWNNLIVLWKIFKFRFFNIRWE